MLLPPVSKGKKKLSLACSKRELLRDVITRNGRKEARESPREKGPRKERINNSPHKKEVVVRDEKGEGSHLRTGIIKKERGVFLSSRELSKRARAILWSAS